MRPGEWQRWRIVHANWLLHSLNIAAAECEQVLLAKDGVYIRDFPRPITGTDIPMGGRADVMIRCPTAGTYSVMDGVLTINVAGTKVNSEALAAWTPTYPDYLKDLRNTPVSEGCMCRTDLEDEETINGRSYVMGEHVHTSAVGKITQRHLSGLDEHAYH